MEDEMIKMSDCSTWSKKYPGFALQPWPNKRPAHSSK